MNKKFKLLLKRIKPVTDQFPEFWKHVLNKDLIFQKDVVFKYMDKDSFKPEYDTVEFKTSLLAFSYMVGFVRAKLFRRTLKSKFKIQIKK